MKKLKLKAMELGAMEVLTRSQLKKILGGDGSGGCTSTTECAGASHCEHGQCVDDLPGGSSGSGSGGSGSGSGSGGDLCYPPVCDPWNYCQTYDSSCSGGVRTYCCS